MKVFKVIFDVVRWLIYMITSVIVMDKVYYTVFPEKKGETK